MAVVTEGSTSPRTTDWWKRMFSRHRLRITLEKSKVMWLGQRREKLEMHLEGNEEDYSRSKRLEESQSGDGR